VVHRPTRLSPFSRQLSPADRVIASPGVLCPYDAYAPGATVAAATGANADRVRRGSPDPRRCRPRAFSAPRRFEPRHPAGPGLPRACSRRRLPPKLRGLVSCRKRPWGSPCRAFPSRRAVPPRRRPMLPCEFELERVPARCRMLVVRVSVARSTRSRGGGTRPTIATTGTGRSFPPSPRPPNLTRVAPRSDSTAAHVTGLADHTAGSPASKLCSLRESVRAAARSTCRSLRPDPLPERRADALLGLSPSGAFSTVPRVRSIAREPGEPDSPGRPRPAPVVERGASILRPRPSESDGCARLAGRSTPTADVAHVRAPSRRRPCLSCP